MFRTKKHLIQTVKQKVAGIFSQERGIVLAYVFGSYAKDKQRLKSDLDIGIVCFEKGKPNPFEIAVKIQKLIPEIEVDVSVVDLLDDALLLIQIINGKLIYQKSASKRIELETRILHLHEDLKHLREIENQYLEKSFKEGIYAY